MTVSDTMYMIAARHVAITASTMNAMI